MTQPMDPQCHFGRWLPEHCTEDNKCIRLHVIKWSIRTSSTCRMEDEMHNSRFIEGSWSILLHSVDAELCSIYRWLGPTSIERLFYGLHDSFPHFNIKKQQNGHLECNGEGRIDIIGCRKGSISIHVLFYTLFKHKDTCTTYRVQL